MGLFTVKFLLMFPDLNERTENNGICIINNLTLTLFARIWSDT